MTTPEKGTGVAPVPPKKPGFDSAQALETLEGLLNSEVGAELQRRLETDEDIGKATFEGLKDVRRMEDVLSQKLDWVMDSIDALALANGAKLKERPK